MTRAEHLIYCKKCIKRKFDENKGIVCSLTNDIAQFEIKCINYEIDDTVKVIQIPTEKVKSDKPTHILIFILFLILSGFISYFIQENYIRYGGDELGQIPIFIGLFFFISFLLYKFFMPVKLSFIHVKAVLGIFSMFSAIVILIFSAVLFYEEKYFSWGIYLLILGIVNISFLVTSKFWKKITIRNHKKFAILNVILFTLSFFVLFSYFFKQYLEPFNGFDKEDYMIIATILTIYLVTILYSYTLIKEK